VRAERSDEELVLLFARGSRDAFEELFARHHGRVVQFCYRMLGDRARAEEAAQEVFLRIARAAGAYRPTARFTTWMYQIARRTTLNYIRDEKDPPGKTALGVPEEEGADTAFEVPGPEVLDPARMAWSAQVRERVEAALAGMPEAYRSALVLVAAEGLSYGEAASVLGITVQALKSRVFRARRMLLASLGPGFG